eukprot:scaffold214364_cov38-Prasinocladus_malaysianus.AAC.1
MAPPPRPARRGALDPAQAQPDWHLQRNRAGGDGSCSPPTIFSNSLYRESDSGSDDVDDDGDYSSAANGSQPAHVMTAVNPAAEPVQPRRDSRTHTSLQAAIAKGRHAVISARRARASSVGAPCYRLPEGVPGDEVDTAGSARRARAVSESSGH